MTTVLAIIAALAALASLGGIYSLITSGISFAAGIQIIRILKKENRR